MSHKAQHTISKPVPLSIPPLPSSSLKVCALHGLSSPTPHPCRKGETVGQVAPSPNMLKPWQIIESWLWAESPGWVLWVQAAQRGQYLMLLPKIAAFKRAGRNVKMFLITNTAFGAFISSLIEPVERDPWISGRFVWDFKIDCISKKGTKQKI